MCVLGEAGAHGGFLLRGHGVEELRRMVLAVHGHANRKTVAGKNTLGEGYGKNKIRRTRRKSTQELV